MIPTIRISIFFVVSSFLLFVVSCASSTLGDMEKISYKTLDNPSKNQIEISYENITDTEVCLPFAVFPLEGALIGWGNDRVNLIVDTVRYPIVDLNPGYCISKCETKVPPGETIFGSIPYSDFKLPKSEFLKSKRLEYDIFSYACNQ